MGMSARLGGDALNGYERDGRYYVSSRGRATEVTEGQWRRSRAHAISVWITHPLAMVSMAYLLFQHVFPSFTYRASKEAIAGAADDVRRSGPQLAKTACSGRVGGVNYSGPTIHAAAYPGGIVIKPLFQSPFASAASAITDVRASREWWVKGIEIVHTSAQVTSPIFLHCDEDDPFVATLRAILLADMREAAR